MQANETELLAQVKKHYDLVMHLEMEKNHVLFYFVLFFFIFFIDKN